jgi:hypothetical protein
MCGSAIYVKNSTFSQLNFNVVLYCLQCHSTVELSYNVMKRTEYFELLKTSVVITKKYKVIVNSEELISITEYLTL